MPVRGSKPKDDERKRFRGGLTHDWVEVPDRPYRGKVPVTLPRMRTVNGAEGPIDVPLTTMTKNWWKALRAMPHCVLWSDSDWQFALATVIVADNAFRGQTGAQTELRQRERIMGTTLDARRDLRIRYVDPAGQTKASSSSSSSTKGTTGKVVDFDERKARRQRVNSAP